MNKYKVEIKYVSDKLGHSRYGYCRRVETVVRFARDDDELDAIIDQFESRHEDAEITVTKL